MSNSKSRTVKLLPFFRSDNQAKLLTALVLSEKPLSVGELSKYAGISHTTALHTLNNLIESGILTSTQDGSKHMFSINIEGKLLEILTDLIHYTYGPKDIITDAISDIKYLNQVYIFGSWAARYNQIPGKIPNDIDLLIVGDKLSEKEKEDFNNLLNTLEYKLYRDINPHTVSLNDWINDGSEFIKNLKSKPLLKVKG